MEGKRFGGTVIMAKRLRGAREFHDKASSRHHYSCRFGDFDTVGGESPHWPRRPVAGTRRPRLQKRFQYTVTHTHTAFNESLLISSVDPIFVLVSQSHLEHLSAKPITELTVEWLSVVGIIWVQSITRTNTNFPAYSSQLKQLNFSVMSKHENWCWFRL
ncbi:uncharacterized protein HKW66_Vig0127830 [Vigna angularis]|uniref:Uncharacterized protein n=1 Tax=Phaseolus angularis TaxID=3914 RepID=A0A8T0K353_PHAAN|nr:uncharacterized protein HKW66_Vig0127830 [Vigna angularis]